MTKSRPLWRQAFDAVEEPIRKRAEAATGTAEFGQAMVLGFEVWTSTVRTVRATSTRLLHLANLPAHADVRRLARQLGSVENKLDKLAAELERLAERLERVEAEPRKRAAK